MHGNVDNDGNLSARFNQGWNTENVSKVQAQVRLSFTRALATSGATSRSHNDPLL